jgi:butyrate kinase
VDHSCEAIELIKREQKPHRSHKEDKSIIEGAEFEMQHAVPARENLTKPVKDGTPVVKDDHFNELDRTASIQAATCFSQVAAIFAKTDASHCKSTWLPEYGRRYLEQWLLGTHRVHCF